MSTLRRKVGVVVVFSGFFLAVVVNLVLTVSRWEGQHQVSTDPIVISDSLDSDVQHSVDFTSISQFGVETFRGYITLMAMTGGASLILLWLEPDLRINQLAYAALALVGLFGTKVPGSPPRRDYNPLFFFWTVDHVVSSYVHVAACAVFLYVPLLRSIWWIYREHWGRRWIALYVLLFVINVGYGVAYLSGNSTLNSGTWTSLESVVYGGSFAVYALFGIRRLKDRDGYQRL